MSVKQIGLRDTASGISSDYILVMGTDELFRTWRKVVGWAMQSAKRPTWFCKHC